jgi:hypothetical protein
VKVTVNFKDGESEELMLVKLPWTWRDQLVTDSGSGRWRYFPLTNVNDWETDALSGGDGLS